MRGQACRKCAAIGHFRVKCPQLYQQGGAQSGFKGKRNSRDAGGFGQGGCGRRGLGKEADLVTGGPGPGEEDNGDFATPGRQLRPDYAFSVEQLDDRKEQRGALITLIIGSVDVPDVLDSGASCNHQTPTSYNPVT